MAPSFATCGSCGLPMLAHGVGRTRAREPARTPPRETRTIAAAAPAPMPAEPQSKPSSMVRTTVGAGAASDWLGARGLALQFGVVSTGRATAAGTAMAVA